MITIRQPWAALIALGEKKYETRSWKTRYRGKLAIHTSKKIDIEAWKDRDIANILTQYGIRSKSDLPVGSIIAVCELIDCLKVDHDYGTFALSGTNRIEGKEYLFGDFHEGRFAWKLQSVQALTKPIQAKGQLNLWEYPVEKELPQLTEKNSF